MAVMEEFMSVMLLAADEATSASYRRDDAWEGEKRANKHDNEHQHTHSWTVLQVVDGYK